MDQKNAVKFRLCNLIRGFAWAYKRRGGGAYKRYEKKVPKLADER